MNKDLHDIDELFRSALEGNEEMPSPIVKKNLDAALDKKDADSEKRRSIDWKKAALLLLLLLTGFVLYESRILKKSTGRSGESIADKQLNSPSAEKHKEAFQNNNVTDTNTHDYNSFDGNAIKNKFDKTKKTVKGEDTILIAQKEKENTAIETISINNATSFKKDFLGNKIAAKKSNPEKESNSLAEEKFKAPGIEPNSDKNINVFPKVNDSSPKEKDNPLQSLKEISIVEIATVLTNSIKQLQAITDLLFKKITVKNTREKKGKSFKSFWMITPFASYEKAGYRLDSDLPTNISSIKHSEVHEPSFSLGVLTTRQLKKQWGLQSGLIYSLTNIGISRQKLYALHDPAGDISFKYITSSGYAYIKRGLGTPAAIGDSLITKEGKHSLQFISIPLTVKYTIGKNKLLFSPGIGIEANFLTSSKVETEFESPSNPEIVFINKLDGAKPFYLSVVAEGELRYQLSNKLSVNFRPAIRFAASPITRNNVVETFPRSVGAGMGLTWKF